MINTVTIAGYLGGDPDLQIVGAENIEVCNFSVAVKGYADKTTWVKCVAWRKTALFIADYLKKGSFIVVQGRLEQEVWQEADGTNRSMLKVVVDGVESPKINR